MVRAVRVRGDEVEVEVALTTAACPLAERIREDVEAAVRAVPGVKTVRVRLGEMSPQEREAALSVADDLGRALEAECPLPLTKPPEWA